VDLLLGGACVACTNPGQLLCQGCRGELPITAQALPEPSAFEQPIPIFYGGPYLGVLRHSIIAFKDKRAYSLGPTLAHVLSLSINAALGHQSQVTRCGLVPLPSSPRAVRRRGLDHMKVMVQAAAAEVSVGAVLAPLLRVRSPREDQALLGAAERRVNAVGRLWCPTAVLKRWLRDVGELPLILCDDVITTGSSIAEAHRALINVGLDVRGVATVAHTKRKHPLPSIALRD
jgi:predicted amidophosphoribosyltransferase